jgi:hypothetical protein
MRGNSHTKILGKNVILVPYKTKHVAKYVLMLYILVIFVKISSWQHCNAKDQKYYEQGYQTYFLKVICTRFIATSFVILHFFSFYANYWQRQNQTPAFCNQFPTDNQQ